MSSGHKYPISELFGPTIQGEGPLAGRMCYFVRTFGCDWRCSWCDTAYAISLPEMKAFPAATLTLMTAEEIGQHLLDKVAEEGDWITLSGGNPALTVDKELVHVLGAQHGYNLAMETQGSVALTSEVNAYINCLVVSPKPPSSGMSRLYKGAVVLDMLKYRTRDQITAVKFVSFGPDDLDWIHNRYLELKQKLGNQQIQWFISVGTPAKTPMLQASGLTNLEETRLMLCENMSDAWDMILNDPRKRFAEFRCLPQLHSIKWGRKAGV